MSSDHNSELAYILDMLEESNLSDDQTLTIKELKFIIVETLTMIKRDEDNFLRIYNEYYPKKE